MKMDFQFSSSQRDAIKSRGKNLLVAAGAGSGKTTVLVERILQYIKTGGSFERILALTFTNAAAADMREKLDRNISALAEEHYQDRHLHAQLSLLPQAQISTIHAFCLDLLRRHYYRVGLDAGFKVAGEAEIALLENEVLLQVLEDAYADPESGVCELADAYGGNRDDSGLIEVVRGLYQFIRSRPRPLSWLKEACAVFKRDDLEQYPFAPDIEKRLKDGICQAIFHLRQAAALSGAVGSKWQGIIAGELAPLEGMVDAAGDLAMRLQRFSTINFCRLSAVKEGDPDIKEQIRAKRDKAKKIIRELQKKYTYCPPAQQLAALRSLAEPMDALYRLVASFDTAFTGEKQRRGWIDFSDMEHLTLQLLTDEAFCRELSSSYDEILIDEYQDINEVQEAILQQLCRADNFFAVGDVKQSIYRFRLAEPQLFLSKYNDYGESMGGRRIDLNYNYRSELALIDGINFIFRQLMRADIAEIEYDSAAELHTKNCAVSPAPEFWLIDMGQGTVEGTLESGDSGEDEDDEEAEDNGDQATVMEAEARLIARRIRQLKAEGFNYGDMAILLRATKNKEPLLTAELNRNGIPTVSEGAQSYLETPEIALILSALQIIDNPRQDIPLVAVLRSPLAGFSPEELAEIRFNHRLGDFYSVLTLMAEEANTPLGRKCAAFLDKLNGWRRLAGEKSVSGLISFLYRQNGYYQLVGAMSEGEIRRENLHLLLAEAYQYEQGEYAGLFRFIRLLTGIKEQKLRAAAARANGNKEDAVQVMSIHKSKGLEFPVVFVAGLAGQFNFMDQRRDIVWERDAGLGPLIADRGKRQKYPSLAHTAIADRLRDLALAEEMRIYYVALTRAKERLILTAAARDIPAKIAGWSQDHKDVRLTPQYLLAAKTPLAWLGAALLRHPDAAAWREAGGLIDARPIAAKGHWLLSYIPALALRAETNPQRGPVLSDPTRADIPDEIRNALSYQYPYAAHAAYPAKWTVSALARLTVSDEPGALADFAADEEAAATRNSSLAPDPAARGSAYHAFLEKADLAKTNDETELKMQVQDLVVSGKINVEQAAFVQPKLLISFFHSDLGKRFRTAGKNVRELEFTMLADTDFGEKIVVQGILDAAFWEKDGWVLLDYKTGGKGKSDAQLRQIYSPQLAYYREAIGRLLGGTVRESWLVMLDLGRTVSVD